MVSENFNNISRDKHPDWSGWYYIDLYKKLKKPDSYIKDDIVIKGLEQKHYSKRKRESLIEFLSIAIFLSGICFYIFFKG